MDIAESVREAIAIMRRSGARRWSDVPDEDKELHEEHPALDLLRIRGRTVVTVAVCDTCGRWMVASSPLPKKCLLTLRCPGKPLRIEPPHSIQ